MYEKIKIALKRIIPTEFIRSNENYLRAMLALGYTGSEFQCNICNFKMRKFITLDNGDKLCPKCGSLGRTRKLWNRIENEVDGKRVLHFSPSKSLRRKLEALAHVDYVTTDYMGEFEAMKNLNIESIEEPDSSYDVIICYHVLEHIENDKTALLELHRVLVVGGTCFIQTPFKEGEIYEDNSIKSESDRLKHFGQNDHVRVYSALGLKTRLEDAGFQVQIEKYSALETNRNGFAKGETILVAKAS